MNQLLKFGLILGVICMAATLVLAATYAITKPKIDQQLAWKSRKRLRHNHGRGYVPGKDP